jgi:hypothetical protein
MSGIWQKLRKGSFTRYRRTQKGSRSMASLSTNSLLQRTPALLARLRSLWSCVSIRRRERSLRIGETVSLGDKRFVAVLEFERQRFLIGVTSQSVSLLQGLGASQLPATIPSPSANPVDARPYTGEDTGEPS